LQGSKSPEGVSERGGKGVNIGISTSGLRGPACIYGMEKHDHLMHEYHEERQTFFACAVSAGGSPAIHIAVEVSYRFDSTKWLSRAICVISQCIYTRRPRDHDK